MPVISSNGVTYVILASKDFKTPYGTRQSIIAKRPRGKKEYWFCGYEDGSYSTPVKLTV